MGMPAWAAVLAAPYAADKLLVDPISSVYGLYKGIRDDQADQSDKQVGMDLLKQFAVDPNTPIDNKMLSKFKDPKAAELAITHALGIAKGMQTQQAVPQVNTLENYAAETGTTDPRFFNDPESRDELAKQGFNGDLSFFSKGYSNNPVTNSAAREINDREALREAQRQIYEGTAGPATYADMAVNPVAKANDTVLNTNMNTLEKERTRGDKEKAKVDLADFQSAISGLTAPSQSPVDLNRFAKRGGYAPISDVEGDIRQAASTYNVGDSDEVNKAIAEARGIYKDTYLPTTSGKVGRTSYTGQSNLLGDFRKDVQSVAPVTNITVQGNRDRSAEFNLRKEFISLPEVKDFPTIESNSRRAVAALNATGSKLAVDQALITVFNKMIDPTSVVRESEYARTPGDMAVLSRIKGKWGKIQEGGAGLPTEERVALARMIKNFSTIASKQYNDRAGEYRQLAKDYGFDPARVVVRGNGVEDDQKAEPRPIAPAGTKARVNGKVLTSDGKGGWM